MSNEKTHSLSLRTLFHSDSYVVPVYQRNYDWGEPQIRQLVDDILDVCTDENKKYYLGSLVVHKNGDYFEILDGQQRFTTLSLILCYLKYHLSDYNFSCYEKPNLSFESRPKSEFAINSLFMTFGLQVNSTNNFLDLFQTLDAKNCNASILSGFRVIERVISESFLDVDTRSIEEFTDYLLNNVEILRIIVPKNTDLTHYFEVMNNRGEQLEKHEIVKANLLSAVQENKLWMVTIQKVWLACSDMYHYVQSGFSVEERKAIFGENCESFVVKNFDELNNKLNIQNEGVRFISHHEPFTLEDSLTTGKILQADEVIRTDNEKNKEDTDEGRKERFSSVIDFPNFLMQVLRIYLKTTSDNAFPPLDDKNLIDAFKASIGKDENNDIHVKDFVFTLLKTRYLFDKNIVKRERANSKEDWSLKRYKFDNNGSSYPIRFGSHESDMTRANWSCTMLLSVFHVSYPSHSRKNWLSAVLYWLSKQDEEVDVEMYLDFLENLAISFMINRYMTEVPKNYEDFIYIDTNIDCILAIDNLQDFLSYGPVRAFSFNYLDYLLWKGSKLSSDTKSKFRFSFKGSVEHFSPQTPKAHERLEDEVLDCFGNLCLMASNDNSSLSNDSPSQKAAILQERRGSMAPLSLKLELMIEEAKDWSAPAMKATIAIKKHEEYILNLLKKGLTKKTD